MSYPLTVFHYRVEWGGTRVGFTEVSGLDQEITPIFYREGSSPTYQPIVMPGIPTMSTVTLKRGIMPSDSEFYTWISSVSLNQVERRDLTISLLNHQHEPAAVWKLVSAWPMALRGPVLDSTQNSVAIESLELAHEGIRVEVI